MVFTHFCVQVAVVANAFVIRKIDPDSPDFMYSPNIFAVSDICVLLNLLRCAFSFTIFLLFLMG